MTARRLVRGDARQRSFLDVVRETTERRQGPNVEALRVALTACRVRLQTAARDARNARRRKGD